MSGEKTNPLMSIDDKIQRTLETARVLLISKRDKARDRVLEIKTGNLSNPVENREYESVLEEMNRAEYTIEMIDMLIKYL